MSAEKSEKKDEKSRKPRRRNTDELLGIPSGVTCRDSHIELIGNREALIEGTRGVVEYSDESITLNLRCGTIEIAGKRLVIKTLDKSCMQIEGDIGQISFYE